MPVFFVQEKTRRKPDTSHFGEIVRVQLTLEEFKSLQTRHGGYVDSMAEVIQIRMNRE